MSDWLIIVPGDGESISHPERNKLASALRCPNPEHVKISEVGGAYFYTVAESADDPGVVIVSRDDGQKCAVVASALLTYRDDFVREIRCAGRNINIESSDGDLLAHAISLWGDKTWEKPGGEFSVASWIPGKKSLLLATDGEGQRPAYWSQSNKGFVASTRFEVMMLVPIISKVPDQNQMLLSLAGLDMHIESDATWIKNVFELRPGHSLYFKDNNVKIQRWWNFPTNIPIWRPKNSTEAIERYREVLFNSVKDRIRGQSKVAIALSAGMDSTPVAATLVEVHQKSPTFEIKAFHAEYPPALKSQEANLTKEVADFLRLNLENVPVGEHNTWPLVQNTHSWPPHHWYGHFEPFSKTISEYSSSVLVSSKGELFSRASLLDSLQRGQFTNVVSAWIKLKKLGVNIQPYKSSLWQHQSKPFKSLNNLELPNWIRSGPSRDHLLDLLSKKANWESPHKRHSYLHGSSILLKGMSHLYDYNNRRVAMIDPYSCREFLKLAISMEELPWRLEKYLPRISFETCLPRSIITRKRTGTPYLFTKFFESGSAQNFVDNPLHPIIIDIINPEEWKRFGREKKNYKSFTGYLWLQPLVLDSWLSKL